MAANVYKVVMLLSLGMTPHLCDATVEAANGEGDKMKEEALTAQEDAIIRNIIYTKGLPIGSFTEKTNKIVTRGVVIPKEIMEVYKVKPVGTLNLFRAIVKGARPEDAIKAAATARALAKGPGAGAPGRAG